MKRFSVRTPGLILGLTSLMFPAGASLAAPSKGSPSGSAAVVKTGATLPVVTPPGVSIPPVSVTPPVPPPPPRPPAVVPSTVVPQVNVPPATPPPATPPKTPVKPGTNSLSSGGTVVGVNQVNVGADYSPKSLDLGEVKTPDYETLAPLATGTVTITAPTDGSVSASFQPDQFSAGRFQVQQLTSYLSIPVGLGHNGPPVWVDTEDRQVSGNADLPVSAGEKVTVDVGFWPAVDDNGVFSAKLIVAGSNWKVTVPVQAVVTIAGPLHLLVTPAVGSHDYQLIQGQAVDVTVHLINLDNAPRSVTLSWQELPNGVSMAPVSVVVPPQQGMDAMAHLVADANAPQGKNIPTVIQVDSADIQTTVGFNGNVYPSTKNYAVSYDVGNVHIDCTLDVSSSGAWTWLQSMHDSSFWTGDNVDTGFFFLYGGYGRDELVQMGCVICGGQSQGVNESGTSEWLKDNYIDAINGGVEFNSVSNADLGAFAKWAGATLGAAFLDLLGNSGGSSSPPGNGTTSGGNTPPGSGSGGGGE